MQEGKWSGVEGGVWLFVGLMIVASIGVMVFYTSMVVIVAGVVNIILSLLIGTLFTILSSLHDSICKVFERQCALQKQLLKKA